MTNQRPDQLVTIAVTDITPNPRQPRQEFDPVALQELADSIKEHGVIQPLIVEPNTDEATAHYPYVLVVGERRLRAAQLAGLIEVPCIVRCNGSDAQDLLELALIENIQREDLSVADEARAYQQLHDLYNLTDEEIGRRVFKARPTVTTTRNLVKLPHTIIEKIGDGDGQLPKRVARQLLPLADAVSAPELVTIAEEIITLDPDDGRDANDIILGALDEHAERLPRKGDGWDLAWPGKPIETTAEDGQALTVIACTGCPYMVNMKVDYRGGGFCVNHACFHAKTELYAQKELARLSKKFSIPVADPAEAVYTVPLDWRNREQARTWLDNATPAHLRLQAKSAADDRGDFYQHKELLGSPVVVLASTLAAPFSGAEQKKAEREERANAGEPESEADRKKRVAAEEEAAARAKRAERGAIRKARADAGWLGLHVADICAPQIKAEGTTLEFIAWFVDKHARAGGNWSDIHTAIGETVDQLETAKGKAREPLLKRLIVLKALYATVPKHENNWETEWSHVIETITDVITSTAEIDKELCLGLKLPHGWDTLPIHQTPSNCWHCGRFAPNDRDELTQVDRADGWDTVSHGSGKDGVTLDDVYCPDCGKELRDKIGKIKPADKNPAAKKPAKK